MELLQHASSVSGLHFIYQGLSLISTSLFQISICKGLDEQRTPPFANANTFTIPKHPTMHKIILAFLAFFSLTQTFGQTQKKVSTYLSTQYNKTIHDQTSGNNPWGIGLGLQAFYNNKSKFKPTIELTGDA